MKIGTTFFERAVPTSKREDHLQFLVQSGFKSVEFCIHKRLMPTQESYKLIKMAAQHSLEICLHSPDFIDPKHYGLKQLSNHGRAESLYRHYLNEIASLGFHGQDPIKMVMHSISAEQTGFDSQALTSENCFALERMLNLIERDQLPFQILLENTCPLDEPTLGSDFEFLEKIVDQFKGAPLSLCMDLAHLFRTLATQEVKGGLNTKASPQELLSGLTPKIGSAIGYAHLHGFTDDLKKSHLPIKDEHLDYIDFVKVFSQNKDQIIFNLEIFDFEDLDNLTTYESILLQHFEKIENF